MEQPVQRSNSRSAAYAARATDIAKPAKPHSSYLQNGNPFMWIIPANCSVPRSRTARNDEKEYIYFPDRVRAYISVLFYFQVLCRERRRGNTRHRAALRDEHERGFQCRPAGFDPGVLGIRLHGIKTDRPEKLVALFTGHIHRTFLCLSTFS